MTSYGKLNNGKVYSPDILTEGRNCSDLNMKCSKNIPKGYHKMYLINHWIQVKDEVNFKKYVNQSLKRKGNYNLLFNNCATWISNLIKESDNIQFTCKFMGLDIPFACNI